MKKGDDARSKRHWLTFSALLLVLAFLLTSLMLTGLAAADDNGVCGDSQCYDLYLICGTPYWADGDYAQLLLSVDYVIGNNGPGTAENVRITEALANNGVFVDTAIPLMIGDLAPGQEETFTLKWQLPSMTIESFQTSIKACANCEGVCTPGSLDIKPYSCPNSINTKSRGNIPVGVISSEDFDATTLAPSTVMFAGAAPLPIGQSPEDINGDGLMDMVFHFAVQDTDLEPGDTSACLSGVTYGGQMYLDCDSVKVLG